jgi:hypothetical protein
MLKEEIAKELKIAEKADIKDVLFDKITQRQDVNIDMEGRYNTDSLSNTEAVGYDNF